MTSVPAITLNDGARIPQLGFGVFQIDPDKPARPSGLRWRSATATSIPRRCTRTRRGVGSGHPRRRPRSCRGVHHQQAQQRLPQTRRRATRVRRNAREARLRLCRPVPHPLAAADALRWRLRLDMANPRGVQEGWTRPQHRCVQLPGRPLAAAGTRNRDHASGEPDRGTPVLHQRLRARLRRRARNRDRGMVADRAGARCSAIPSSSELPRRQAEHRLRSCCVGTSSAATSSSPNR